MNRQLRQAFITGVEHIAAWSDLLDDINVFPVADGDTGRNLLVTLSPLRNMDSDARDVIQPLVLAARGNSGIIAARFFSGFLTANTIKDLPQAAQKGRDLAWNAIQDPRQGTMLDVMDALTLFMDNNPPGDSPKYHAKITAALQQSVLETTDRLDRLKQAQVVDSGALGIFIYLEGFFGSLANRLDAIGSMTKVFKDRLRIRDHVEETGQKHFCIDMVIQPEQGREADVDHFSGLGDSVVVVPENGILKVHLHADNKNALRKQAESIGRVVAWNEEDLVSQVHHFRSAKKEQSIHVVTDAAGSVTRQDADELQMTLLDSYILAGDRSLPETYFTPADLYLLMKKGTRASTSQASTFERHQHYQSVIERHDRVLYLCVGSFYTGNHAVAMDWKRKNDPEGRLTLIDTGAASGRLGLVAINTALKASQCDDPEQVIAFARQAIDNCREYLFVDCLKYLARGGRMSKTGAFFGDMFRIKPVVTPTAEGAQKVAIARNQTDQMRILYQKLSANLSRNSRATLLLQYTDNEAWVSADLKAAILEKFPLVSILIRPLSLTSGVHTGPGTWSVAFLPDNDVAD